MDTEKQRQRRHDDVRLIKSGNARSKQLYTHEAYGVANQQRMAARKGLEWIGTSKPWVFFRNEISDLLLIWVIWQSAFYISSYPCKLH